MKRSVIIVAVFLVLAGTAFTMVQNNRHPKSKTRMCSAKPGIEKQDKKTVAPMPYIPAVNFF